MLDLNDAYRLPIKVLRFLVWDADDDLAQATWEWPAWGDFKRFPDTRARPYEGFERAARREVEAADRDWERRGKKEFARQIYR
jgi:hypothetical protein